jgi:hypothetical protein
MLPIWTDGDRTNPNVCTASGATSFPPDTDHTFTKLSPLPETICCPSGLKATEQTIAACPASDAAAVQKRNKKKAAAVTSTFGNLSFPGYDRNFSLIVNKNAFV